MVIKQFQLRMGLTPQGKPWKILRLRQRVLTVSARLPKSPPTSGDVGG